MAISTASTAATSPLLLDPAVRGQLVEFVLLPLGLVSPFVGGWLWQRIRGGKLCLNPGNFLLPILLTVSLSAFFHWINPRIVPQAFDDDSVWELTPYIYTPFVSGIGLLLLCLFKRK